jgi:ubiquinone biosynthesis protein UbiJ
VRPPLLLSGLEWLSVRLLGLDPRALESARAMSGRVIAVELLGLGRTVYVLPHEQGIALRGAHAGDVHVRIRGTPLALLRMASGEQTAGFGGGVEIIGDLELARHLQAMLASLAIDWEELVSQYLGDIAAHQIGNLVRGVSGFAGHARHTLEQDTVEYLRNELAILVETHEIAGFVEAVDVLRSDADRLEARIKRIAQALARGP